MCVCVGVFICVENQNLFSCATGYTWQYHVTEKTSFIHSGFHNFLKSLLYFMFCQSWVPSNLFVQNLVHHIHVPYSSVHIRTHRELVLETLSIIYVENNRK